MAVVSICSTKGGVGKTTLVICLADAFARQGGSVVILDADPNGHVTAWREMAGEETTVDVISGVTEDTIQAHIEDVSRRYSIVLIDLEGAASQAVTYAIAWSDLVLIPTKTSGMGTCRSSTGPTLWCSVPRRHYADGLRRGRSSHRSQP
jgi:chromosome partitioning protein